MALCEGSVDVLNLTDITAASPHQSPSDGTPDAQDVSSTLRSIRGLFAAPKTNEALHRAHKRRKVDHHGEVAEWPADIEEEKSIVLAKVSLELVSARARATSQSTTPSGVAVLTEYRTSLCLRKVKHKLTLVSPRPLPWCPSAHRSSPFRRQARTLCEQSSTILPMALVQQ
jgi:hypothetical protein